MNCATPVRNSSVARAANPLGSGPITTTPTLNYHRFAAAVASIRPTDDGKWFDERELFLVGQALTLMAAESSPGVVIEKTGKGE